MSYCPVTSVLMVNVKFHSFIKVLLLNESESPRQLKPQMQELAQSSPSRS